MSAHIPPQNPNDVSEWTRELQSGQGYVVLPNLIPTETTAATRAQIIELAYRERSIGKLIENNGRWRLRLVDHGDMLLQLALHPIIMQTASILLGEDFVMGGLSAHTIGANAPPQGLHIDYPYSVMAEPFPEPLLQVQAIWALDDFTPSNGATRVLAHSQKTRRRPDREEFYKNSTPILCPAGSLILSHGGLWHDSSTNHTTTERVAILGNYTPFWVRSIEGFPETVKRTDESYRKRLGYNFRDAHMRAVGWKREDKSAPKPPY